MHSRRKQSTSTNRKRRRTKSVDRDQSSDSDMDSNVAQVRVETNTINSLKCEPVQTISLSLLQASEDRKKNNTNILEIIGAPTFTGVIPQFGGFEPPPSIMPEPIDPDKGFNCIAGYGELLEQVRTRILFPLKNREFMEKHGRTPPKGLILHGAPGTGKTLFAKCLAAELSRLEHHKYSFFMRRGTDMMSKWVGESEKTIRQIFAKAVQCKPSILFFDEIDGLCPNRNTISSNACPVFANVVCTLLGEMDKIRNGDVLVLAATNRIDAIDPAMLRPGRCDVSLAFHPPNIEGRKHIIELYTKNWGESAPSSRLLNILALSTNGFTGADLNKLCSEAFFACIRRTQKGTGLNLEPLNGNEKVLEKDWLEALSMMKPSKSNVFGSYIQVLEISEFIQPLVRTSTNHLLAKLRPHVPTEKQIKGPTGGPNCFLAWNACDKVDDVLDSLIIPTVLGELTCLTVFVLSEETMLQEHHTFTINSIINIIKQAKECEKPSILFIPRIDKLSKRLAGETPMLRKLLFDTGNKSVIVLATASRDVAQLPLSLQSIFDGHNRIYELERPTLKEREEFFKGILVKCLNEEYVGKTSSSNLPTNFKNGFEKLACEAAHATDHNDIWSMITLHRELTNICKKFASGCEQRETLKEMQEVVREYTRSHLDAGK